MQNKIGAAVIFLTSLISWSRNSATTFLIDRRESVSDSVEEDETQVSPISAQCVASNCKVNSYQQQTQSPS